MAVAIVIREEGGLAGRDHAATTGTPVPLPATDELSRRTSRGCRPHPLEVRLESRVIEGCMKLLTERAYLFLSARAYPRYS